MTAASGDNVVTWTTTHGDRVTVFPEGRWIPLDDDLEWEERRQWHWHVQAGNNRIVEQGEGHPRRRNAIRAALRHHPRIVDGEPRYELWSS